MNSPLSYAELQERKRRFTSIGITFGLYGLAFAVGIFLGIMNPQEQTYSNVTVLINMPGPITNGIGLGSINPSDKGEEADVAEPAVPVKAADSSAKVEAPKAKAEAKPAEKVSPKPEATPAPAAKAKPSPAAPVESAEAIQGPGAPSAVESSEAVPAGPWVPGQRDPGSHISETSTMMYVPGKGMVPWTGSTVTIRKAEKGTSSDTTLGGSQGTVGQNLYVPVYSSLPPPRVVSAAVYNAIPDLVQPPKTVIYTAEARKRAFTKYYEFDGTAYRLKSEVPIDEREPLWQILEDAGFNTADADYKQGKNLAPVVIVFTVTRDNQLKGAEIFQSSGDTDIDKAVLYGFKRAAFWNKTGETVPGRFTYRF